MVLGRAGGSCYEQRDVAGETSAAGLVVPDQFGQELAKAIENWDGAERVALIASGGLSHFVIKVESMEATIAALAAGGVDVEPPGSPDGSEEFRTAWITDPDGNRIELVQWPAGHPDGITASDWSG